MNFVGKDALQWKTICESNNNKTWSCLEKSLQRNFQTSFSKPFTNGFATLSMTPDTSTMYLSWHDCARNNLALSWNESPSITIVSSVIVYIWRKCLIMIIGIDKSSESSLDYQCWMKNFYSTCRRAREQCHATTTFEYLAAAAGTSSSLLHFKVPTRISLIWKKCTLIIKTGLAKWA